MAGAALEATGTFLSIMSTAAQFAPVPYTGAVISLAESILTMVQRVRSNKVGFQQLATDIQGLVGVIRKSRVQSSDMKKDLRGLFSLLTEIKDFVEKHSSHNLFHRMMNNGVDASTLQDYRGKIQYTLRLFMFKTQINIHENIARILVSQEKGPEARLEPSEPGSTGAASPPPPLHRVDTASSGTPPPIAPGIPPLPNLAGFTSSSFHTTVGNFNNCRIEGAVSVMKIDGDYTSSTPSFSFFADSDRSSDYGNHHLTRPASPEELVNDGDLSAGILSDGEPECKSPNDTPGVHLAAPGSEPTLDADKTAPAQDAPQSPQSGPITDTVAKPESNSVLPLINSDGTISNRSIANVSILQVAGNRNENHFYSAPTTDPTTPTPLPDDLRKAIAKNRSLRPILGVAMAFHGSPSVLQIARVLDLKWEAEVSAALKPISSYFEHLDSPIKFNSDVRPRQILRDSLLKRAGTVWLDAGKYHNFVARWCLVRQTLDAKDIIYANDFWDFHVRNANPSPELYEALKSSWIPLDPVSHEKLPGVIHWLEENGGAQASDLLAMYQDHSGKPRQEIQIMGGLLKFSF
ncbi:hypothetical protein DFH06DRAFT_1488586 [Mycena polygramma]|nr:hypothetical protein DFH06DRAFT_1488586 [Mycena polygramma]